MVISRANGLLVEWGRDAGAGTPRFASRPRGPDAVAKSNSTTIGWVLSLRTIYVGCLGGNLLGREARLSRSQPGNGWTGLRRSSSALRSALAVAGRALQLLDWDRSHQFCGRCGSATTVQSEDRARVCPKCRLSVYPRIAPAIMALVRKGSQVLLGRSPHFPAGMYSALAGFVEPGETLEQCVVREVEEEVCLRVSHIRYFASQPWPFPHQLMIAFVCDWESGEINPREGEIEAAHWFDVLQLPKLPSRISISRRLIDAVTEEMRARLA